MPLVFWSNYHQTITSAVCPNPISSPPSNATPRTPDSSPNFVTSYPSFQTSSKLDRYASTRYLHLKNSTHASVLSVGNPQTSLPNTLPWLLLPFHPTPSYLFYPFHIPSHPISSISPLSSPLPYPPFPLHTHSTFTLLS